MTGEPETSVERAGDAASLAWTLVVAAGPDAGKRFVLDETSPPRVLLGKSPVCDFVLSDPGVSRRHAALEATPLGLRVTDLGSTNGTWVAGIRIVDAYLSAGQAMRIGSTTLQVLELTLPSIGARELPDSFGRVLGKSAVMRRLYRLFWKAAKAREPVLIEGETGTGKELLAESLHETSARASGPFVVFDCAAARDGDTAALASAFDQASGGTLLLDEVGELHPSLQAVLARAALRPDVRIVSTTRRDLDREIQQGRFREELYHRLAVLRLELPPLRARLDDVEMLAAHFHRLAGGDGVLPGDLKDRFPGNRWPGNVRELQGLVTRRVTLGVVDVGPFDERSADLVEAVLALGLPLPLARERIVDAFERRYVESVLAQHGGNVGKASAASGIARRYFQILRARHKGKPGP